MISVRSASAMRHASGCRLVAAASGQLLPRMNCLPPLSCKVAAPPRSFKTPRAVSILRFRFLTSTPARCAAAIVLPASRIPARNSLFDNFLEKTVKRMSRRGPVGLRENLFCLCRKPIRCMGFSKPVLYSRLANKAIPLQAGEMRPYRIVGQA